MKKKVLILVLFSMVFCGIVSAATLWGSYKGYPIIRVKIDNRIYKPKGVPPIVLNTEPLVPLSILKETGIPIIYNKTNATIEIKSLVDGYSSDYSDLIYSYSFLEKTTFNFLIAIHLLDEIELLFDSTQEKDTAFYDDIEGRLFGLHSYINDSLDPNYYELTTDANRIKSIWINRNKKENALHVDHIMSNYMVAYNEIDKAYTSVTDYLSNNKPEEYEQFKDSKYLSMGLILDIREDANYKLETLRGRNEIFINNR